MIIDLVCRRSIVVTIQYFASKLKNMVGRAFSVKVDFDLHAITCPGVWLCPNGKVALQIHIFNSCMTTHRLSPIFPLLYHDKFTFKKVFTGVITLAELEKKLTEEYIFAELIQWSPCAKRNISLATFQTNLVDLLYPVPCYKGLLTGIDVDLLMEPSKFFPGILSPKIEVSTRTTIKEVTDFDIKSIETRLINPKVISSVNQSCMHKKKELSPNQRIIRQKKVCHTSQKKLNTYLCRLCRKQNTNIETVHNCNPLDQCSLASKNQCYLSSQRRQICSFSPEISPQKACENYNICNDAHILDSCPICLKYKCYFSNKKSKSNGLLKLYDVTNYVSPQKDIEKTTKLFNELHESYKSSTSKLPNGVHSHNLHNDLKNCHCETRNEGICSKDSLLEKHKSHSICRSNSVPSFRDDLSTSILLAKMKQLEKTKERLNYANCPKGDSDQNLSCDDINTNEVRKGFYKNLGKFYKRMYKQTKQRVHDLEEN